MAGLIDAVENAILDRIFSAAAYTPPATLYAALFTSAPADTGSGGTECAGVSYARVAITNNATNFPAAAAGSKSNGTAITFATPGGAWGTIQGVALMDAASSGNMIIYAPFTEPVVVDASHPLSLPIGSLTILLD